MTTRLWGLLLLFVLAPAVPGDHPLRAAEPPPAAQAVVEPATPDADPPAWPSEFPSLDRLVWTQQRGALIAGRRAQRPVPATGSLDALELQVQQGGREARLEGLHGLLARDPERLARALQTIYQSWYTESVDPVLGNGPVREFATAVRRRLPELSRELAARLAYRLLLLEHFVEGHPLAELPAHYEGFLREYGATATAPLAEIDLIESANRDGMQRLAPLDRLAREHAGTIAGAKALYLKGFTLSRTLVRAGPDPLDRFVQVEEIVRDLQSGRWPASEWVDQAPGLIIQFSSFRPSYAPGTVDRMLDGYRAFAAGHLARVTGGEADDALTFVVGRKMGELFEARGDGLPAIEQVFADLERIDRPRARYLLAELHMRRMIDVPAERPASFRKAAEILTALYTSGGGGLYERKALAALATLHYFEGDPANAGNRYREYVERYPRSDLAWLAALRAARADEQLGNASAARASYRAVAVRFADLPVARVLGNVYAAQASEALSDLEQASADYRRAADDAIPWTMYTLYEGRLSQATDRPSDPSQVTRETVVTRLAQLQAVERPGGSLVEHARWLLDQGRAPEALARLAEAMASAADSSVASDARYLSRRARIEIGLDLGNDDAANRDDAGAVRELESAVGEPFDFGVFAAKAAKATVLWKQRRAGEADALMTEALQELHAQQRSMPATPQSALEQDVASIRSFLFTPTGSVAYRGLKGFAWPASPPPFALANAEVSVRRPGADTTRRMVRQPFPTGHTVLFLTGEQIALLDRIITKLGGTRTRRPTAVMEVPNQPIGSSQDVLAFWNRHFPARPGHWWGWELLTSPVISGIDFVDEARTQAIVHVTIGSGGGALLLQRQGVGWSLVRIVSQWVT